MTVYTWAQLQRLMDRYVDGIPYRDAARRWVPWLFPDPNPFPRISLFPRLERIRRWFGR